MARTEEDKILQAPVIVKFNGKEYSVRPLVIKESREWRKQLIKTLELLPKYVSITTSNPEGFSVALNAMLADMPNAVADLFFSYAKDLPREEIESTATDAELAVAFQEVMAFAFPLAQALTKVLGKARTEPAKEETEAKEA